MCCDNVYLQKALNGDKKAIEYLIKQVQDQIFNIAVYFTGDFELAKDCTQEILIRIVSKLGQVEKPEKFENWSYTIATNFLRNFIRGASKFKGVSFEAMQAESSRHYEKQFSDNHLLDDTPELIYELKVSCTLAMLMCLGKEDRILFILSNLLGFNSKKLGEILVEKPDTIRKRLSRANKKMKNFIENNCGLLNKNAPCHCKQRANYAILQKRLFVGRYYFQNPEFLNDNQLISDKIQKMNSLEDVGEIFKNNPNYTLKESLLDRVYKISEI